MAKGKPTDPKLQAEIVSKIRDEGMSVADACKTYCPERKGQSAKLRRLLFHAEHIDTPYRSRAADA